MPRQPRLDAPGLLQHVMARGIERRKLFRDDKDRNSFLDRLATILEETQTQCYAWALIPNHFHLLVRTGATPLSKVMRRLMTGYAVTFNRRHKRSGHLFQNRYKSVVCEEDPYLLELIRYIHLNPIRAGLVNNDLKQLDKYPWTGHSVILGRRKNPLIPDFEDKKQKIFTPLNFTPRNAKPIPLGPTNVGYLNGAQSKMSLAEKTIKDVLLLYSSKTGEARRIYRQFVKEGVDQGSRPELQGGGLVRSAGGDKRGLLGRKKDERELSDERILGSGDFVAKALEEADELGDRRIRTKISLRELISLVSKHMDIEKDELLSSSRKRLIGEARAIIAYQAIHEMGYKGTEVSKVLGIRGSSVSQCVERGKKIVDSRANLRYKLIN